MRRPLTEAQKQKAQEKRDRFKAIAKQLADMGSEERAAFAASCPIIATTEGHVLSVCNTALVIMQCPNATMVGGFNQWLRAGRAVSKGQSGLTIWVPGARRKADSEVSGEVSDNEIRFLTGTVFDVSQTVALTESEAA